MINFFDFETTHLGTIFQLDYEFDFDCDAVWKAAHSDGGPCVFAVFPEDFNHQVRKSVDDGRLLSEVGGTVHHSEGFDASLDDIESAELAFDGCEELYSDEFCGFVSFFDREVSTEFTGDHFIGSASPWSISG